MPLLLPNLDDRPWADLVAEARALIPVYGPEWTDHNAHDPGITLVELLAAIAEMDIYQLNQVSDRERLKFLALVGVHAEPPQPARAVLGLGLADAKPPVALPAGLEFEDDGSPEPMRYRTLGPITVTRGSLEALQFRTASGFQNLTSSWRRRAVISPFGPAPEPGAEFYLGLTAALPVGVPVQFFFTFADGNSGYGQRLRLLQEAQWLGERCRPPFFYNSCKKPHPVVGTPPADEKLNSVVTPKHHGVRTVWQFRAQVDGEQQWLPLDPVGNEVEDDTRAFTLDGTVTFRLPSGMTCSQFGSVPTPLFYLRCRFEAGAYDAAPELQDVALNGIQVAQAVPSNMSLVIDPKAQIIDPVEGPPKPGDWTTLTLELDPYKKITRLVFGTAVPTDPKFMILDYRPPGQATTGLLSLEAVSLGFGTGLPGQQSSLPEAPVELSSFQLYTLENDAWQSWRVRDDFDSSLRTDFHFLLDPVTGTVTFGDGEKGCVPPGASMIFATFNTTRAEAGNLAARTINRLADSAHNRALLYASDIGIPQKLQPQIRSVTNSLAASGGASAETMDQASGRAAELVMNSNRAITLDDYQQLAAATPGTRIARVSARANLHPSFPCFKARGVITLIVLPYLPQGRPDPGRGLLRAVAAYLRRRRVIGTRVEVTGPTYLDVAIRASVQGMPGSNKVALAQAIVKALNDFLDPLKGGPEKNGWPIGRDVYRSEIMRVIDEVAGVDYVASMDLIAKGCQPQCGNVCLGPTWLVAAGQHEITVG